MKDGLYETLKSQNNIRESVKKLIEIDKESAKSARAASVYTQKKSLETILETFPEKNTTYRNVEEVLETINEMDKNREYLSPSGFHSKLENCL